MKRAIVVGARGQDGRLLCEQLTASGALVFPIGRGDVDLTDRQQVRALVARHAPAEVYYLAAHHYSSEDSLGSDDAALLQKSLDVHAVGPTNFLEAIRQTAPAARFFYAASSHVFGDCPPAPQDELTPLNPSCIYGISKTAGVQCCRYYRQAHGIFASVGYLYNHESPLRRQAFVTQKIVRAAVRIAAGLEKELQLGSLSAAVDWGYAADYTEAMQRILAHSVPDDFVVATGEVHSVQEFVEHAFTATGLQWRDWVREIPTLITRRKLQLIGNAAKLRGATGWQPTIPFHELVQRMVEAQRHAA